MKQKQNCAALILLLLSCVQACAGYTHYFTWHEAPSDLALTQCVAEMSLLIDARKSILVGPDLPGAIAGSPKVEAARVDINGIGDDAHEPFVFPGEVGFNFCKTQWKPYDEVVTACLIVARDHFPKSVLAISSDGSWADWAAGASLYSSVLHRGAKNPMGGDVLGPASGSLPTTGPFSIALTVAFVALIVFVFWSTRKLS
jgi:hypothetical protein